MSNEKKWKVIGSTGNTYNVKLSNESSWNCQCDGFYHRNNCSHIDRVKLFLSDKTPINKGFPKKIKLFN